MVQGIKTCTAATKVAFEGRMSADANMVHEMRCRAVLDCILQILHRSMLSPSIIASQDLSSSSRSTHELPELPQATIVVLAQCNS